MRGEGLAPIFRRPSLENGEFSRLRTTIPGKSKKNQLACQSSGTGEVRRADLSVINKTNLGSRGEIYQSSEYYKL